jgi:hypothetical protein
MNRNITMMRKIYYRRTWGLKASILFSAYLFIFAAVVSGYALFKFISLKNDASNDFKSKIVLEEVYNQREAFVFYSEASAELAAPQAFWDMIAESGGISEGVFTDKLRERMLTLMGKYPSEMIPGPVIYAVSLEGERIRFEAPLALESRNAALQFPYKVKYSENLIFYLDFQDVGLESPKKIVLAIDKCKKESDRKACYERELQSFSVSAEKDKSVFTTKRKYSFAGKNTPETLSFFIANT